MPSLTVENYLKAILQLELRTGTQCVSTGQLATALGVSPGTVTSMQKALDEAGLANYRPYEGVTLSDEGRRVALRMLRRHRLIELFLVQTLNLTWDQVHEEAENMEHAVSDFLVDRMDEFLGRPEVDPHGDPIPARDGALRGPAAETTPLVGCPSGSHVRFARVMNQDPDFLRFLTDAGLEVGSVALIRDNNSEAGVVELQVGDRNTAMGHQAAEQVLVETVAAGAESAEADS